MTTHAVLCLKADGNLLFSGTFQCQQKKGAQSMCALFTYCDLLNIL